MKKLIPMNSYGLFADTDETARVDSRFIAQTFNKRHRDVLRDIRNLLDPNNGLSANFSQRNFALTSYVDSQGKRRPCYQLTRDGFVMLIMGYNGAKANRFKELYIHQFNEMEEQIKILRSARIEFPMLTQQIQFIHENPKAYHYSNECDLINRIVLGMSAKKFREEHGLEKGTSIRPYLSSDQLKQIDALQKIDIGLMVGIPNYQERKQKLEWYYANTYGMKGLDSNATA
ncbi:Rha family transcriptional regulator [Ligilactobacillus ruminis]|uniref:Rha family transcriptional regulator n=1 Tax=Ligilactobacillus ruminis TaxID=1623 RepID=UPI0022E633A9|nr:Rha family transcriptional regulator [Ligilactobacillus ruminis]